MKPRSMSLIVVASVVILSALLIGAAVVGSGTPSHRRGSVALAATSLRADPAPDPVVVTDSPTTTVAPTTTTSTTVAPTTTTAPPTTTTSTTVAPVQTTTTTPQRAAAYDASAESQLVSLVNNLRASVGVPALAHAGDLRSYARSWSQHMSDSGSFAPSNVNNVPGPWQSAAENIAVSDSVQAAFNALVASSGHYANMINGTFTEIGSGVWADADGSLWITNVFRG